MNRHQSRILAMQAACQLETVGEGFLADLEGFLLDEGATGEATVFARRLVEQVHHSLGEIDAHIASAASNWDVKRMALVDRAILRIAVCELLHDRQTPVSVVIDEAVELGKAFGSAESGAFVNGVLDAIARRMASGPAATGDVARADDAAGAGEVAGADEIAGAGDRAAPADGPTGDTGAASEAGHGTV